MVRTDMPAAEHAHHTPMMQQHLRIETEHLNGLLFTARATSTHSSMTTSAAPRSFWIST
jgi:hypothetical protein